MRLALAAIVAAVIVLSVGFFGITAWPIGKAVDVSKLAGNAERGAYLARMSGCIACHTDFAGGGQPLAGGVALETQYGTFYSPNLTTDPNDGIGAWSVNDFAKAVRQGVSPDGQPYYPAFPYPFYGSLSDQDVADLWAAFQTVPPVAQGSMEQELSFPFDFRSALKLWRSAFLDGKPITPLEGRSELWNRGRYIVEGPAHCAACHTPRNVFGARITDRAFEGADNLPNGGSAAPITVDQLKANGWTVDNLKYGLQTGILPDGDVFGGAMGEVVRDGTSFLTDEDLAAIATYLLDQE